MYLTRIILFIFSCACCKLYSQNHYNVILFLLEDCKISQAYIPEINRLQNEFESDSIEFKAFFPNPTSSEILIKEFIEAYNLNVPCVLDVNQSMAKEFDIRVMPEVVVYLKNTNNKLYQGRIDNWFAGLGKRRSKATEFELEDCLVRIKEGKPIKPTRTKAVGCYLTRL